MHHKNTIVWKPDLVNQSLEFFEQKIREHAIFITQLYPSIFWYCVVIIHRQGEGIYAGSSRNNCFGYKSQFKTLLVSTRLLTLSKHYLIYKTQTFIFHNILQGIMFHHRRCSEIQIPFPGIGYQCYDVLVFNGWKACLACIIGIRLRIVAANEREREREWCIHEWKRRKREKRER